MTLTSTKQTFTEELEHLLIKHGILECFCAYKENDKKWEYTYTTTYKNSKERLIEVLENLREQLIDEE